MCFSATGGPLPVCTVTKVGNVLMEINSDDTRGPVANIDIALLVEAL